MSAAVMTADARSGGRARPVWDSWLLGSTFILLAAGLIMVYSSSIAYADREMGNSAYFLVRHVCYTILGLLLMAFTMRTRVRWWQKMGPFLLLVGIISLFVVLVPGVGAHVNGSTRWIRLGAVNLQPSEFMKIFTVVYVAGYLVRKQETLRNFTQGIVMISLVVAIIGALLLMEPDMGSLVVISVTVFAMLFLGGVRFWHFMMVLGAAVGSMVLLTIVSPYRMARATSFMDPFADPYNTGFQLVQALIAFGRGEWFGAGLGASVQKLFYLPAAHTDFVFAVIAEELGLVAVLAMMALFAIIIVRAFAIARQAEAVGQVYSARLAQGIGLLLGGQAMINMGVNMGLLPTKGLTLPFVSYGGSSMVASCIAMGLLLLIGREVRTGDWGKG
ncbi:MAG: putative lipid II flippase FtsW [Gammaproteobacteria bacterium]|nr:putative lipid II flippase FtsW [Gammaproteobacteria bacterium]MDH5511688.1 putative lipid II flippase FtsW [Gammaproteobacteria bacterium]